MQATGRAKNAVFVPGDLDLQTSQSQEPNASSMRLTELRFYVPLNTR